LWESRYKSSLIDAENYLLTCYRYIELNPMAANMVMQPQDYQWSSYNANAWGKSDLLITPHEIYLSIDKDLQQRQYRYRELFKVMISDVDIQRIRSATNKNFPLGDERFKKQIEQVLGRKIGSGCGGRPRKSDD
jgi:putative transposase